MEVFTMFAVKLNKVEKELRARRFTARKLYNTCQFEAFKSMNAETNMFEHNYKMATQTEVKI